MLPCVTDLQSWSEVFQDPGVWRPAIEEIWRRHGLGRVESVELGFPGSNAVFLVNRHLWVKISWPFENSGFEHELECYRLLTPSRSTLLCPSVVVEGTLHDDVDWRYFVMDHVPGKRLADVWTDVPRKDQVDISEHLGRMVRVLHGVPLDGFQTLLARMSDSVEAWGDFVHGRSMACLDDFQRRGGMPAHLLSQVPDYLAAAAPLFPVDFTPVLMHGDVTEDHVLLSQIEGHWRITGFIDYGDALVGHSEYEFTCVHLGPFARDGQLTRLFLAAYGWDCWDAERFGRRMMAYCVIHPWFRFDDYIEELGGVEAVRSLQQLAQGLWGGQWG